MEIKDIFTQMGITEADQKPLLEKDAKVSLFSDAIDKTHVTRITAVDDPTITGKAVKAATDKINIDHQAVIVGFGKSINAPIDPNSFIKDGVFDSAAFNQKASTDLGTALTKFKEDNKGDESEKITALEASLLASNSARDTFQGKLNDTIGDLDTEKKRNAESEKQTEINGFFSDTFRDSIKFDEEENDLTIEAIEGRILKGAKHGLDENGEYTCLQLDGKPFMNESKTKALTPPEVHLKFAVAAKAKIVMNDLKKKEKTTTTTITNHDTETKSVKGPYNTSLRDRVLADLPQG